jgi:hypothetical protein
MKILRDYDENICATFDNSIVEKNLIQYETGSCYLSEYDDLNVFWTESELFFFMHVLTNYAKILQ